MKKGVDFNDLRVRVNGSIDVLLVLYKLRLTDCTDVTINLLIYNISDTLRKRSGRAIIGALLLALTCTSGNTVGLAWA